jgi:DNA polymerase-3 subunit epsilon
MLDRDLVFVDLETTGANPGADRITEIGIVEVRAGVAVGEWSSLVNPEVPIPPFIASMTGISDAMVAGAPTFREIADELVQRLRGRLFVAHNARFDYGFVRNELHRVGVDFQEDMLCTVRLSRKLWPEHRSHGLDAVMSRHGIVCEQRHRALGDARVLLHFMHEIYRHHAPAHVAQAVHTLVKRPAAAPGIAAELLDAIPPGPGVYRLYGDAGALLYVGKSSRLRAAVHAHFDAEGAERDAALARAVRHVDWIETAGELGAQLRETKLLRSEAPTHNRVSRPAREPWSLCVQPGEDGASVTVVRAGEVEVARLDWHFGLFRSRRAAEHELREFASAHGLCLRRLNLDAAVAPCTAGEPGQCGGECLGREAWKRHDARLLTALAPLRLRAWPYRGPIGVRETDRSTGRSELHVIDHWQYLGSASDDAALAALLDERRERRFDHDGYRLFTRLLARRKAAVEVVDLTPR